MGLFDFFKKSTPQKVGSYIYESNIGDGKSSKHENVVMEFKNFQKDSAGLYPHEILLLSYYEKYYSGKEIARFWKYEFDIDDVPALMRALEEKGFAKDGKLTDAGKEESKRAEYIQYIRKHKFSDISVDSISILVNKYPDIKYRDIIWGEFNRLCVKYLQNRQYGWYRNTRYNMYLFLTEENRYQDAFTLLAEVLLYDLNGSASPLVPPRIIENIRDISKKLDMGDEQIIERLRKEYSQMRPPYINFSAEEVVCVFTAYATGNDEIAQEVLKRHGVKIL